MGNEHCFPLGLILNADIVISPSDVKLGKVFHILEFVNEVRDERKRVGILDGMPI